MTQYEGSWSEADHQAVGVDGSAGSGAALRWAVSHADTLGPVCPVVVSGDPSPEAERLLAEVSAEAGPEVLTEQMSVDGRPGDALVAAGAKAGLLVVGSRGRGALASRLLGSVSTHCVREATVPVVVVPAEAEAGWPHGRVVVGFDGSDHARRALQWAVRHTPASCRIEVVHAYDPEQVTGAGVPALHAEHLASQSSELLAQAVDAAQAGADNGERELIASSQLGDPRLVLRREGHLADALVVGVRGHRPMVELLVGSVTTALVERPDVVTVVVR